MSTSERACTGSPAQGAENGSGERPAPRLGVLGGGQLAKMTAAAAAPLGCEVFVLERREDFPAQSLDTQAIIGDWNDPVLVERLGGLVDVVTLENEFVSVEALAALERAGHPIYPAPATMRLVRDKLIQKRNFAGAGLPLPRFVDAPSQQAVLDAAGELGWPLVLKRRRDGYDGKGNATVREPSGLAEAWRRLDGDTNPLYVEAFCDFDRELAIILTRAANGDEARYPVVTTVQRDHICHTVTAPADVDADTAERAAEIASTAVRAIDGVGSFGLELFHLSDGRLLVNEIAPRVHNTGHYTIEACECSQFENHVRAVLGWPLGSTALVAPAAAMVNLLGAGEGSGRPHGLEDALAVPGAHVHVYGKTRANPGRKMGHVTALGASPEAALERARDAASRIRFGGGA